MRRVLRRGSHVGGWRAAPGSLVPCAAASNLPSPCASQCPPPPPWPWFGIMHPSPSITSIHAWPCTKEAHLPFPILLPGAGPAAGPEPPRGGIKAAVPRPGDRVRGRAPAEWQRAAGGRGVGWMRCVQAVQARCSGAGEGIRRASRADVPSAWPGARAANGRASRPSLASATPAARRPLDVSPRKIPLPLPLSRM